MSRITHTFFDLTGKEFRFFILRNKINMSAIKHLFFWVFIFGPGCSSPIKEKGTDITYYKNFDIFNLEGSGLLKSIDKNGSVEVKYKNQKPVFIKYHMPERTVTLILEDSILINNRLVYVYSTSNFNGGQPGKHRVYSFHYEEYKHLVYVSFSDTLLVETEDVPKTRNFLFDLYIRQSDEKIIKTTKGEIDFDMQNAKLSRQELYIKWVLLLKEKFANNAGAVITESKLPPE